MIRRSLLSDNFARSSARVHFVGSGGVGTDCIEEARA